MVQKCLRVQGTQTANPQELRETLQAAAEHKIVPDIELYQLDDVPDLMDRLAKGGLTHKVGIHMPVS